MKTMKRALAVLLAAVLLCVGVPLAAAEDEPTYQVGDQIQFGTYPQTRVDETAGLANAAEKAVWKSYNYYTGTGSAEDGNMMPSDYMQFADFFCNGVKYRAVTFSHCRPIYTGWQEDNYQERNGFRRNKVYYFKYEPLTWRILNPTEGYIMCENVIDSQAYQNTVCDCGIAYYQASGSTIYANDYSKSSIRDWLNYDFFETAFTEEQKNNIQTPTVPLDNSSPWNNGQYSSEGTLDKIYLLSYSEATNNSFGFEETVANSDSNRQTQGTDYSKCQGLYLSDLVSNYGISWWLRSPGHSSWSACYIKIDGDASSSTTVCNTSIGVRPACRLASLYSDSIQSEKLFSLEAHKKEGHISCTTYNDFPATCTTASGYDSVTYCTICGKELSRLTVYEGAPNPDAHNSGEPVRENEQSATCKTAASYEAVTYCTLCGEELSRETVYEGEPDPEAHDMQIQSYVAPTCEEGGYAPFVCSRCGYTEKTDPEPALGHDYNIVYTWAKDDSTVTAEKVCSRCGDVTLKEVADVTTEVAVKPTCSAEGELTLTAAFKNKAFYAQTKTKVLSMDPDAHVFRVTVTPPTCLDDGYTTHACTLCRYGYSDEIVAALGHDYVNAKATGNADGTHTLTCNRCKQPGEAVSCTDANNDGKCDMCGEQMQGGDHCRFCGKIHDGAFGWLVRFFHNIFAIFKR